MGIGRTLKNIGRLRQIATVFTRHGFYEILQQMGVYKYLGPFEEKDVVSGADRSVPERLRLAMEELGGTFIKLGQILSTRPDLIPTEYIEEFRKLTDSVTPQHFEDIKHAIESGLGLPTNDVFAEIVIQPLGSASIAQVHKARLLDGTTVVIKVQRPKVAKLIETDLSILFTLADLMEKYVKNLSFFQPSEVVSEFARAIREELDFTLEARHCDRMRKFFEDDERLIIPEIWWDYTTSTVMVMQYINGIPVSDVEALRSKGYDLQKIAYDGADIFFKMVFECGMFHGDLHGGNVIVVEGQRIALIDFGLVGTLSRRLIEDLASMFVSLFSQDYNAVARRYLKLAPQKAKIDVRAFADDLERLVAPRLSLSLNQIDTGQLILEMGQVAMRHKVSVPRDLIVLAKTLVGLEGIGRSLDPQFDVTTISQKYAKELVLERYSPERVIEELVKLLSEVSELGKTLPSQVGRLLDKLESDSIAIEANFPDKSARRIGEDAAIKVGHAIISAGATVGGAMITAAHPEGSPGFWGYLCFLFAVGFGGMFLWSLRPWK